MEVATAAQSEWQQMSKASVGMKALLLTAHGIAIVGVVPRDTTGYEAWAPLPKRPDWLRERRYPNPALNATREDFAEQERILQNSGATQNRT